MTPTKRITPAGITKHLPRIEQSEPPYNWATQTRRELVERDRLAVKEQAPELTSCSPRRSPLYARNYASGKRDNLESLCGCPFEMLL